MNISTFILFIGFLLFSGFNFVLNLKCGDKYLKLFTYILGIASSLCAGYLLWIAFMNGL